MSSGDGPPPVFDGDDFPYWKIRMEAYLEAIDIGVYKAATQGFPKPRDPTNLVGDEFNYEKWNAKAKNTLFRGLCKDVFNRVRNHKNAHDLWMDICALHEGTRSEREERYHIAMRKLNSFEMLANENANAMYSRLNILVEEVNGLGLTQISQPDVVRKILSVLPIDKYGHIVTVLHQMDLSVTTPTQILGKINAHEMYMHINDKEEYTQIIRKSKAKCDRLKNENESLNAKYDIVIKASDEIKEENKTMSSTINELTNSLKDAKEKYDKLNEANRELQNRLVKIKEDYTQIKFDHDNLLVENELLSCKTHEAINPVVKLDVATSCDDLIQEEQTSLHAELTEKVEVLTLDNQKLKNYLTDATTRGKVAIENNDFNNELAADNQRLKNEVKKLKSENEHLATSVQKFNKGQYLQNELLMNTVMKNNKSGIGYNAFVQKKAITQYKPKQTHKPIKCFECGNEGHFAHNCKAKPPTPLPKHSRPFAFNAHYVLRKVANGKIKVTFLGPPNKSRPRQIWVAKSLIERVTGPMQYRALKTQA